MKTVLQIEFSSGILEDREAILRRSGCRVMSVLGCDEAQTFDPVANNVGVIVIGHGALREERQQLVSLFREKVPDITIVCLLRYTDKPFKEADFNVPADNPAVLGELGHNRSGTFGRIPNQNPLFAKARCFGHAVVSFLLTNRPSPSSPRPNEPSTSVLFPKFPQTQTRMYGF